MEERNTTPPRIAYCRVDEKGNQLTRKDRFSSVTTVVWSYNYKKNVIHYGASLYFRRKGSPPWIKKDERNNAIKKFEEHPIHIQLDGDKPSQELSSRAIDWFIATHLVPRYGLRNLSNYDTRRIHGIYQVKRYFNEAFDKHYKRHKVLPYVDSKVSNREESNFPTPYDYAMYFAAWGGFIGFLGGFVLGVNS